jgi:hypothetical protein
MLEARIGSRAIAAALGLLLLTGCAWTDEESYTAGDSGIATIRNLASMPIYLGGCAPFVFQRRFSGAWFDLGPPFVCVWEGIAVEVLRHEDLETPFTAPSDTGLYRLRYPFGLRCDPDLPLSQANCEATSELVSREFEVGRELCAPEEFSCRFVPAAPNYLCEDGIHIGGPSGECTRDPTSGACGYEFLSCP